MAATTGIEWTDHTFNPWIGCTKVSPACDGCYAEVLVQRWGGDFATRRRTGITNWKQPLRWNNAAMAAGERRRVFCASLADVFDNQVPQGWREDLWDLVWRTGSLDWQLLTKRPQNMGRMLPWDWDHHPHGWSNVWLGTTVENQVEAKRRIPHLRAVPAAKRFLSCEPLLEAIEPDLDGIDWVICGGESGSRARPSDPIWVRRLRDQCKEAGVAFFFKQWGDWHSDALRATDLEGRCPPPRMKIGKKKAGRLLDGKVHDAFPCTVPEAGSPGPLR